LSKLFYLGFFFFFFLKKSVNYAKHAIAPNNTTRILVDEGQNLKIKLNKINNNLRLGQ